MVLVRVGPLFKDTTLCDENPRGKYLTEEDKLRYLVHELDVH